MSMTAIRFHIVGTSPYSQSRRADLYEVKKPDESMDEFDERTWRLKAHTGPDGESIVIPAHGLHQAIIEGAQKGRLIPTAAKSKAERLSKRVTTGIMLLGDVETDMKLSAARKITIQANADGKRGSGKRVPRRFPEWPQWSASFDVAMLDETMTIEDLVAAVKWAGLVAGVGRFRPTNGGHNGRFAIAKAEAYEWGLDKAA
jgi:hypothetical protein